MRPRFLRHGWFAIFVLACLIGCGGSGMPRLAVVPVQGQIRFEGKPLSRAEVVFVSNDSAQPYGARAITDDEGKYELVAADGSTGAVPGAYKVIVRKHVMNDGSEINWDIIDRQQVHLLVRPLIPERYTELATTPLTAKVPAGGATVNFDLPRADPDARALPEASNP